MVLDSKLTLALACVILAGIAPSQRHKKVKPVRCVRLAVTWDQAVADAKLLRRPIVVHTLKYASPPSEAFHKAVLQSSKYARYCKDGTVVVALMTELADDAPTYAARDARGRKTRYLAWLPGLRIEDAKALNKSGAAEYDFADVHPYTTVVDPFTRGEVKSLSGSVEVRVLLALLKETRLKIERLHGKPKITRKELDVLAACEVRAEQALAKQHWRAAIRAFTRVRAALGKWPRAARARVTAFDDKAGEIARRVLAEIAKQAESKPAVARRLLTKAWADFHGSPFEAEAEKLRERLGGK